VHLKNLKPSPPASAIVDRCIECGFCESNCPSRDITLTPRQRITTWREISRLQTIEGRSPAEQQRCAPAAPAAQARCPAPVAVLQCVAQMRGMHAAYVTRGASLFWLSR